MAVKMRLKRMGAKKAPFYRVVVADSRSPRDGKIIELIGTYNPLVTPAEIKLNEELALAWLEKGAIPTDTVKNLLSNAGIMKNGGIYTVKVKSDYNLIYPLRNIREEEPVAEKYFLTKEQIEKFTFLKGAKKIPRIKPNGEPYYYTEGSMPFPDNLDAPARTMLTSESGISRTTHVIEDFKTKKPRLLTPKECERINGFPDDWTNTGMTDKRRYFMMGNALVVGVIERIGKQLEQIIEKED